MNKKNISPIGDSWKDFRKTIFTEEEIEECDIKVALIGEIIKARKEQGKTQTQLEAESGVKQPVIARMEKGQTDPQLSTVIKVLNSLGKTLAIVPLKKDSSTKKVTTGNAHSKVKKEVKVTK